MFVVGVFAAGRYAGTWKGLGALAFSMAVGVVGSAADPSTDLASSWGWSLNAVWIFALGVAFRRESQLRARAATAGAAQARAEAAEAQLRLARNLHDVLSHSLSVIVVQAEVADTYLATILLAPSRPSPVSHRSHAPRSARAENWSPRSGTTPTRPAPPRCQGWRSCQRSSTGSGSQGSTSSTAPMTTCRP